MLAGSRGKPARTECIVAALHQMPVKPPRSLSCHPCLLELDNARRAAVDVGASQKGEGRNEVSPGYRQPQESKSTVSTAPAVGMHSSHHNLRRSAERRSQSRFPESMQFERPVSPTQPYQFAGDRGRLRDRDSEGALGPVGGEGRSRRGFHRDRLSKSRLTGGVRGGAPQQALQPLPLRLLPEQAGAHERPAPRRAALHHHSARLRSRAGRSPRSRYFVEERTLPGNQKYGYSVL